MPIQPNWCPHQLRNFIIPERVSKPCEHRGCKWDHPKEEKVQAYYKKGWCTKHVRYLLQSEGMAKCTGSCSYGHPSPEEVKEYAAAARDKKSPSSRPLTPTGTPKSRAFSNASSPDSRASTPPLAKVIPVAPPLQTERKHVDPAPVADTPQQRGEVHAVPASPPIGEQPAPASPPIEAQPIPPPEELQSMTLDAVWVLCTRLGLVEGSEEEDEMEEIEDFIAWLEKKRRPAAPPVEELEEMRLADLRGLCRELGISKAEADQVKGKKSCIAWIEKQRPAPKQPPACGMRPTPPSVAPLACVKNAVSTSLTPPTRLLHPGKDAVAQTIAPEAPTPSYAFDAQQGLFVLSTSSNVSADGRGDAHKDLKPDNVLTDSPTYINAVKTSPPRPSPPCGEKEGGAAKAPGQAIPPSGPPRSPTRSPVREEPVKGEEKEVVVSMMKFRTGPACTHEIGEQRKFWLKRASGRLCKDQEPLYINGKVVLRTLKEYEELREHVKRSPCLANDMHEFVHRGDAERGGEEGRYSQLKMHVWTDGEDCPAVCLNVFILERVSDDMARRLEAAEGGRGFKDPREVFEACRKQARASQFRTMDPLQWSGPLKVLSNGACVVTYGELQVRVDEANKTRLLDVKSKRDAKKSPPRGK